MNKVKMFFIAAALVLTTAGVFAGKAKFATGQIVAWNGVAYYQITPGSITLTSSLNTPNTGAQATITSSATGGAPGALYSYTAPSTYVPLFTQTF